MLAANGYWGSDSGMRLIGLLIPLVWLTSCVSGPRIVATDTDIALSVYSVADALVDADVVALGELHLTPDVHKTHYELITALYDRRPNMVIAMEMFDRDIQAVLMQYLSGLIDEDTFRAQSRPWPCYARDYRPVIEFAKKNQIIVLAANAPRKLASKAAKKGLYSVIGAPYIARETTAPQDAYWAAFNDMMKGHAGMLGSGGMERYYASQCLKDDTMAESITDHLARRREKNDRPLAILICGRMHSDYGRGTVQRIKNRMPDLKIRILSAETVSEVGDKLYASPREVADYVIVAREPAKEHLMPMGAAKVEKPEAAKAGDDELPTENPEGMRPALGFMPDYAGADVSGVGVGPLREGGPAAAAGIKEGDVIVALKGIPTPDIETYTEVLDEQIIGRTISVKVRKGDAEVDLQVKVGSRSGS